MIRLFIALLTLGSIAVPAHAEWRMAETAHFRVYSDGPETRLRQDAQDLERFDQLLRLMTGVDAGKVSAKLDVYQVRDKDDFQSLSSLGKDVAGFYTSGPYGLAAFSRRTSDSDDRQKILQHEYAHHFMMQHFTHAYPAWYVEGFAELFSTARFRDESIYYGEPDSSRVSWLIYSGWLDWQTIMGGNLAGLDDGRDVAMFYAQSWLAAHYFQSDAERGARLSAYLRALGQGEDLRTAFETHIGSFSDFGRDIRRYSRKISALRLRLKEEPVIPMALTVFPDAADDLLPQLAALSIRDVDNAPEGLVDATRETALALGDSPYAQRALAQIDAQHGDASAAIARLAPMLASAADDPDLLYLEGLARMRLAEDDPDQAAPARSAFARAFKVRPGHYQTIYFYTLLGNDMLGEEAQGLLWEARRLAPQVGDISIPLAMGLAGSGKYDVAERVIAPFANNPHGSASPGVRALYTAIRDRDPNIAGRNFSDSMDVSATETPPDLPPAPEDSSDD